MCKGFTFRFALKFAMVLIAVKPALAAQAPEAAALVSEEAAAKADALREAAQMDVRRQRWAEAEAKLLAAFGLNRSYDIAANLGNAQYRLGKYRDAAEHLAFAVRSWPVIGKREQREFSAKRLAEVRKQIASVTIRVSIPGAILLVDGKEVGRSPLETEVFVEPGRRTIEAKLEGYEPASSVLDSVAGSAHEVSLTLAKSEAKSAAMSEGQPMKGGGVAQAAPGDAGVGIPSGAGTTSVKGGPSKVLIIAGAATSGVLVVTGIVSAAVSNAHAKDETALREAIVKEGVREPCLMAEFAERCDEHRSNLTATETFGNLAIWSFVVGGALGAGTAIYALVTPRSTPKDRVGIAPLVTSSSGGLIFTGRW